MIQILPKQFENILPLAVEWAEAKEKVILEHGTALFPQYMQDAKSVGVRYPDRGQNLRSPADTNSQTPHIESGGRSNSTHFIGNYRYLIKVWNFHS